MTANRATPIAVVGAGPAGLLAAVELAERGVPVDLFSLAAARRGPTASAGRSLAVALEGDAEDHLADAVAAGEGLGDARALRAMIEAGPAIADDLVRRGVPFARAGDGHLARSAAPGHRSERLLEADLVTSFHVVHVLDDALRAAAGPAVRRLEGWEVLSLTRGVAGAVVGLVAQDLRTMEIHAFPASAVILASGGFAALWSRSSAALGALGGGTAAALRVGATLVDPDRIDVHPLALAGGDKPRPIPDVVRSLGVRVWVPADAADNRRPRDVPASDRVVILGGNGEPPRRADAARTLARALAGPGGCGDGARRQVAYLELAHLGRRVSDRLGRAANAIEDTAPASLLEAPLPVAPAVHATLGGLAIDLDLDAECRPRPESARSFATDVPGLFAIGGAAAAFDGASRLAGHRLLFALFGARTAAAAAVVHRGAAAASGTDGRNLQRDAERERERDQARRSRDGDGILPHVLAAALGDALLAGAGPLRDAASTATLARELDVLETRARSARPGDGAAALNRGMPALRRTADGLLLARAVAAAGRARLGADRAPASIAVRAGEDGAVRVVEAAR